LEGGEKAAGEAPQTARNAQRPLSSLVFQY
jgi:hypothetical protein